MGFQMWGSAAMGPYGKVWTGEVTNLWLWLIKKFDRDSENECRAKNFQSDMQSVKLLVRDQKSERAPTDRNRALCNEYLFAIDFVRGR